MEEIGIAELLEDAEISEWFDWIKTALPPGGVELPSEETSVLFVAKSLRLADRIRPMCRHLSDRMRSLLIEAAILHQCWSRQRKLQDKVKAGVAYRSGGLPIVVAIRHIRRMKGEAQPHLMEAHDGFRYVVKFPNNPQGEMSLATEMICTELARLMGLPVPQALAVSVDAKLIRETKALRIELPHRTIPCEAGLCLGSRYIDSSSATVSNWVPDKSPRGSRSFRQLVGALVFDIWTLNLAHQQVVFPSKRAKGRLEAILVDQSHCLMGGDWSRFLNSSYREPIAPRWIAGRVTGLGQLQPWIRRAEGVDMHKLWELAFHLPPRWYGQERRFLTKVLDMLLIRRSGDLRRSIHHLIKVGYFANFKKPPSPSPQLSLPDPRKPGDENPLVPIEGPNAASCNKTELVH